MNKVSQRKIRKEIRKLWIDYMATMAVLPFGERFGIAWRIIFPPKWLKKQVKHKMGWLRSK